VNINDGIINVTTIDKYFDEHSDILSPFVFNDPFKKRHFSVNNFVRAWISPCEDVDDLSTTEYEISDAFKATGLQQEKFECVDPNVDCINVSASAGISSQEDRIKSYGILSRSKYMDGRAIMDAEYAIVPIRSWSDQRCT
jgi:hypothetical protein